MAAAVGLGLGLQVIISRRLKTLQPEDRSKSERPVRRAVQHALSGCLLAFLFDRVVTDRTAAVLALAAVAFLGYCFHRLRLCNDAANRAFMALFGPILRPDEERSLPGAFHFLLGTASSILFFPKRTAILAILMLA